MAAKWYYGEVREVHEGGKPPGFGGGGAAGPDDDYDKPIHHPGHPDHGLPGGRPDHIWGGVGGRPNRPDQGLPGRPDHIGGGPLPPPLPGIWPPLTPDRPAHPLPPDSPWEPGTIWPGAGHIDNDLPGRPPHIGGGPARPPGGATLPEGPQPPNTKPEKFVVLCWISGGVGWNYVVVDTSLHPGMPLPNPPDYATGQPVPEPEPAPAPKAPAPAPAPAPQRR
jgi:hypothetical protein